MSPLHGRGVRRGLQNRHLCAARFESQRRPDPRRHLVDWHVFQRLDLPLSLEKDAVHALLGRTAAAAAATAARAEEPEDGEVSDGAELRHFQAEQDRVEGAGEEGEDAHHLRDSVFFQTQRR